MFIYVQMCRWNHGAKYRGISTDFRTTTLKYFLFGLEAWQLKKKKKRFMGWNENQLSFEEKKNMLEDYGCHVCVPLQSSLICAYFVAVLSSSSQIQNNNTTNNNHFQNTH